MSLLRSLGPATPAARPAPVPEGLTLHHAVKMGNTDAVVALLAAGADVNAWNAPETHMSPRAPLHVAASEGNVAMAKLLLAHSADVNAKDSYGRTPLHLDRLADPRPTALPLMERLLSHGAEVDVKDQGGETPLQTAADWGFRDRVELLQKHGRAAVPPVTAAVAPTPAAAARGDVAGLTVVLSQFPIKLSPGRGLALSQVLGQADVMATQRAALNELVALSENIIRGFLQLVGVDQPWRVRSNAPDEGSSATSAPRRWTARLRAPDTISRSALTHPPPRRSSM